MDFVITALCSVLSAIVMVEILALSFRLNFWRRRANAIEYAALIFADTADERIQEKLVLSAALNLLSLVLYVLAILAIFFLVISFIPEVAQIQDSLYLWSTSAACIAYAWLRATLLEQRQQRQLQQSSAAQFNAGYNRIARWLHWMALEIGLVRSASFELEKAIYLKKAARDPRIIDQPVYVMGLARSGTTVVLEILEKVGPFSSPTYRDMPFVLCPNFWQGLTRHSRLSAQFTARAHGDGIAIGFDSPESFEEIFWRTACQIKPGPALAYASNSKDTSADFAAYRQLSLLSALQNGRVHPQTAQSLRYLSKNNNNLMRIKQLSAQAGAHLVLMIRDPLATAWSLYRQHQRFVQIQAYDTYVRAYMRWLGHHEFGQGHKPLAIGTQHLHGFNPAQPDYWLAYWLGTYQNLWQTFKNLPPDHAERTIWVPYERMCQSSAKELSRLFSFFKIDQSTDEFTKMLRPLYVIDLSEHFDDNLVQRARELHWNILESIKP